MTRVLTPEQRAAKQQRDRARRAEQKAAREAAAKPKAKAKAKPSPTVASVRGEELRAAKPKVPALAKPFPTVAAVRELKAAEARPRQTVYGEVLKMGSFRATEAQHDKLRQLGGSQWIRNKIDAAKV